jgi:hypothetical protein
MDHLKAAGIMRLKDSDGLAETATRDSQSGFQTSGMPDTYCTSRRKSAESICTRSHSLKRGLLVGLILLILLILALLGRLPL